MRNERAWPQQCWKSWELLAEKFNQFQTLLNNMQQGVQTDATCNIQQCWELLTNNVASVCTEFSTAADHVPENVLNFLDNCLAIYKSLWIFARNWL